jgi:hypothetical protein
MYGGGGAGGFGGSGAGRPGGVGGDGLIILTYTPLVAASQARAALIV